MKTVKQFPVFLFLTLLLVSAAAAQVKQGETVPPGPTVVYQAKFPIALNGAEYDLLSVIMEFPAGAGVPEHFHGGSVLVTVLSGEMTLKENGSERIVKTGESWTENPGAVHAVVNKGKSARVAVSMLLPKGAEATTLVK